MSSSFSKTLELRTSGGAWNYAAYLLADENGNSVKFAKYAGQTRADLVENEEFGLECLIKSFHELETRLKGENKTLATITRESR